MKSIRIPSSVDSIGEAGFHSCSNLESVSFEKESKLANIGSYGFARCFNLTSIKLPSQLENISSGLFEECSKLKSIIILSDVSKIGNYSFLNCSNLECLQFLGTKEPSISQNAFQGCKKLKNVNVKSTYPSKTFGTFEARKLTNRVKIAWIVISGSIIIITICIILLFAVQRRKKNMYKSTLKISSIDSLNFNQFEWKLTIDSLKRRSFDDRLP